MENNNGNFWKGAVCGALVTVFLCFILLGTALLSDLITVGKDEASKDVESEEGILEMASDKVERIMKIMDSYYLEEYDEDELVDGMLEGMLMAVGDPYTGYYDEESFATLMESSEGVYYGIGVVVQQNIQTGEVLVVNPYEDCPGAEAGMRPGDIIYKVADVEVTGMDLDEVVSMIKGAEGTTVNISVLHEGDRELTDLVVERRQIEVHTVEHEMLDDEVGYVQVTQFDLVTTEQFVAAMEDLEAQGMQKLIIDLRDNPGGSLETTIDMLDTLLPKGTYTYLVDKHGNRENYKGKDAASYEYPTVILVNENSASASELFSGAMQDYKKAIIVGTTTFGKGIVQQIFSLRDGTGMKVTMAKYYTPNGVCIHKTGIEPDVIVELDEGEYPSTVEFEEDEQLQKAIEILTK